MTVLTSGDRLAVRYLSLSACAGRGQEIERPEEEPEDPQKIETVKLKPVSVTAWVQETENSREKNEMAGVFGDNFFREIV